MAQRLSHRDSQISSGHLVHAKLVRPAICRATIYDDGCGLELLNAVPEMLDVVAVAEHRIGRKDVKFGHFGGKGIPWL